MLNQNKATEERRGMPPTADGRRWRALRPRRPKSIWGWLLWALVVLLFLFIIMRIVTPWWYAPAPTTPPVVPPSEDTRRTS